MVVTVSTTERPIVNPVAGFKQSFMCPFLYKSRWSLSYLYVPVPSTSYTHSYYHNPPLSLIKSLYHAFPPAPTSPSLWTETDSFTQCFYFDQKISAKKQMPPSTYDFELWHNMRKKLFLPSLQIHWLNIYSFFCVPVCLFISNIEEDKYWDQCLKEILGPRILVP